MLNELSHSQKTQLEIILKEKHYKKGEFVWELNQKITRAVVIKQGLFEFRDTEQPEEPRELVSGSFVGETESIVKEHESHGKIQGAHQTSLQCISNHGILYQISKKDLNNFLINNPGLKLLFIDQNFFVGD